MSRGTDGLVLTRAEVVALSVYVYAQPSKVRTYNIVSEHNVVYVLNPNGARYRLTPERLG